MKQMKHSLTTVEMGDIQMKLIDLLIDCKYCMKFRIANRYL